MRKLANDFLRDGKSADPESKTPMGAAFVVHHLNDAESDALPRAGQTLAAPSRAGTSHRCAATKASAPAEQMVGDKERDPILDVRETRVNVTHWS